MRDDHGQGKPKHAAKHQQPNPKSKVGKRSGWGRGMEVAAYALLAIAAVLGIITGAIYSSHRIPAIVLFGITLLLTDVSICLFWVSKTNPAPPRQAEQREDPQVVAQEAAVEHSPAAADTKPKPAVERQSLKKQAISATPHTEPALDRIEKKLDEIKKNTAPVVPTSLSSNERGALASALSGHRGGEISIVCIGGGCTLADSVVSAFEKAEWRVVVTQIGMLAMAGYPVDLSIGAHLLERGEDPAIGAAVKKAFASIGIDLEPAPWTNIGRSGQRGAGLCLVIGSPRR